VQIIAWKDLCPKWRIMCPVRCKTRLNSLLRTISLFRLYVGYDGIPEFVPALLELIQSKLAGSEVTGSDKNVVQLEKASAFYLPPICEVLKGNHAEPAVKVEKVVSAESCLKLTSGSQTSAPQCSDNNVSYVEPVIALSSGNGFKSHHNDVSNGTT